MLLWFKDLPNLRILSHKNNEPMLFILFRAMTVIISILDRPSISLVHIWKSIKKWSSFAKKKIQLCWSTHAHPNIQLGGMILKLSPLIDITTNAFVWKPGISTSPMLLLRWLTSRHLFTPHQRKGQLISECIKGPLVTAFRSPLMKVLDSSVKILGLWIVTSWLHSLNILNQNSIKLCLIVHLVAMWTLK